MCLDSQNILVESLGHKTSAHTTSLTIRWGPQDRTPTQWKEDMRGIRHHMQRLRRTLEKRLGEHQKQTTSAIQEHQSQANHEIDWKGVKILDKESVDVKWKIKEAIHIRRQRPTLNRDAGLWSSRHFWPPVVTWLNNLHSRDNVSSLFKIQTLWQE